MPSTAEGPHARRLEGDEIECQLSRAALVDNPEIETLTTFCGTEDFPTPKYNLELAGWQDYGTVDSRVRHAAHRRTSPTRTTRGRPDRLRADGRHQDPHRSTCKPTNDPEFGGDAGAALTGTVNLDVIGDVVDGTGTGR